MSTITTKIAKYLLKKSGWIEDYYYVVKVMYSCLNTPNIGIANIQLINSFYWGQHQIVNKLNILIKQYSLVGKSILIEGKKYTSDLYEIKWKIQDYINYETV